MKNEQILFQTTDLCLASYLYSIGLPIEATEHEESSNRVRFFFKRTNELDELVQIFWRREAVVEPLFYFQAMKIIKTRIHS